MTDKTINQLTTTTSAAAADLLPIWVTASGVTRAVTKANFMGGAMTGGGTVATGGFTLTVPATGTAALVTSGTWTPTVIRSTGGLTYTAGGSDTGAWYRIANLVYVSGIISGTHDSGGSGGSIRIITLPSTPADRATALIVNLTTGAEEYIFTTAPQIYLTQGFGTALGSAGEVYLFSMVYRV